MKKRWLVLLLLGLCLLAGCGKQEDPALLQKLEACDAACDAHFQRKQYIVKEGTESLLLEFRVREDYFGNLSTKGKDLTDHQMQNICVCVSETELRTEPLHTWLRAGTGGRTTLFLTVMEETPEWATEGRTDTVFRLLSPDSFCPRTDSQEDMVLTEGMRKYAKTHEKARIPDAVWYDGGEYWADEGYITDFYWTEEDCQ